MRLGKRALMLAGALVLSPAAQAEIVNYPFKPEDGATWKITETHDVVSSDPAKPSSKAEVVGTLKVVGATEHGYLMEWTTNTVSTGGVTLGANGPMPEMMIGVPISFDADENGMPLRIRNAEAVIDNAMSAVVLSMGKKAKPADLARTRAFFVAMDDEDLANRFLEEVSLIGRCQNLQLDTKTTATYQIEQPNVFGGQSITANLSARVDFAGSDTKLARFITTQSYDPESVAIAVLAGMRKLAGDKAADDAMKDGKLPTIRYDDTTTCHVDTASGEAVKMISDLDTFADGKGKRDTRTITLKRQ